MKVLWLGIALLVALGCVRKVDPGLGPPPPVLAPMPLPEAPRPHHKLTTAFVNVRVFDGVQVIPKTSVLVEGRTITQVAEQIDIPAQAVVVQGQGRTLLPGLIDAHTHPRSEADLVQALRYGVTTEISLADDPHFSREVSGLSLPGRADLYSAGSALTAEGGHGTQFGPGIPALQYNESVSSFIEHRFAEGSQFLKIIYDHYRPTLSIAELREAVAFAHSREKMVVVHISDAQEASHAVYAGADGLAHPWWRGRSEPQEQTLELMKERKLFVLSTLSVLHAICGPGRGAAILADPRLATHLKSDARALLRAGFGSRPPDCNTGRSAVQLLHRSHIPVVAGTDAGVPGTAHGASLLDELALLVQAGLTPHEALKSATSHAARAFQLGKRGHLAEGFAADLVLVEGDPSQDIKVTREIVGVWKGGQRFDVENESTQPPQ